MQWLEGRDPKHEELTDPTSSTENKKLRAEALLDCNQAKRPALDDDNESSDEETECTSIKSFDVALTLSKDLLLSLIERGEGAAEDQQKVISALEDAKLKLSRNSKQSTLHDFVKQ